MMMILFWIVFAFFINSQGYVSGVFSNGNVLLSATNFNPYGIIYRQNSDISAPPYYDSLPSRMTLINAYGFTSGTYQVTFYNLRTVSHYLKASPTTTIDTRIGLNQSVFEIPPQSKILILVNFKSSPSTVSYFMIPLLE